MKAFIFDLRAGGSHSKGPRISPPTVHRDRAGKRAPPASPAGAAGRCQCRQNGTGCRDGHCRGPRRTRRQSMCPAMMARDSPNGRHRSTLDALVDVGEIPSWKWFGIEIEKTITTKSSMNSTRLSRTNWNPRRVVGDVIRGSYSCRGLRGFPGGRWRCGWPYGTGVMAADGDSIAPEFQR